MNYENRFLIINSEGCYISRLGYSPYAKDAIEFTPEQAAKVLQIVQGTSALKIEADGYNGERLHAAADFTRGY